MDTDNVVSSVADVTMVWKMVSNDVNMDTVNMETTLESKKGADVNSNANVEPTASTSLLASVSFAALLKGDTSQKSVNFRTLNTPARNGADVVIPLKSIRMVSERFVDTAYGFFIGKRVAYPIVANYFSLKDGLDAKLENGPWFIHYNPLILKSQVMLEQLLSFGDVELKDTIVMAIPKLKDKSLMEKITLVDDDGKPLPKVVSTTIVYSDSEVEDVIDDHAVFMASTELKRGADIGYGTNSLLEQWRITKQDGYYNPYDDDLYESHDMSENL
ncbi:hypothetical protein Tco_0672902 [Tanacetum coccineum]